MSETPKFGFNWVAEFEKCENPHDLLQTAKAAAAHIRALETELKVVQKLAQNLVNVALDL